jgi:hypothetical protein
MVAAKRCALEIISDRAKKLKLQEEEDVAERRQHWTSVALQFND